MPSEPESRSCPGSCHSRRVSVKGVIHKSFVYKTSYNLSIYTTYILYSAFLETGKEDPPCLGENTEELKNGVPKLSSWLRACQQRT